MMRFHGILFFVGIANIICASQQDEPNRMSLRIDTIRPADICSGSHAISRSFFNEVDLLAFRMLHDVYLTKAIFADEHALLTDKYKQLESELSDQAKKHAQASLKSLKTSLEDFR